MKFYNVLYLLFILCFVLTVPLIHASNDLDNNITISKNSIELPINDCGENVEYISSESPEVTVVQGESIPININTNSSGTVDISIDGRYNSTVYFEGNDIINISTFDGSYYPEFDSNYINLKPGIHNISFIFILNSSDYKSNVFIKNSILTFEFIQNSSKPADSYNFYYKTKLIVLTKNRSVNILEVASTVLYDSSPHIKLKFDEENSQFIIFILKEGKIINYEYDSVAKEKIFEEDLEIEENKLTGIFNLTVVNLKDGTWDSALFFIYNDLKVLDLNYEVKNYEVTFFLEIETQYNITIESYVLNSNGTCSPSILKNIVVTNGNYSCLLKFEFTNLISGHYECIFNQKSDYWEYKINSIQFEINDIFDLNVSNEKCKVNDSDFNKTMLNYTNNNYNSTGNHSIQLGFKNKNISSIDNQNFNSNKKSKNEGDKITVGEKNMLSDNVYSDKYYYVSKKFISNSINIELVVLLSLILSLLIGYLKVKDGDF